MTRVGFTLQNIQDRAVEGSNYANSVHRQVYMYLHDLDRSDEDVKVRSLLQETNTDDQTSVKDLPEEVKSGIFEITGWNVSNW